MAREGPEVDCAEVARYYDEKTEHEWERMDRHRTEFAVTLRALGQYLPPPPARLLDCGGGPGRYAVELARQGYEVTLFDLSRGNLALARAKAAERGICLAYEQGTAIDLARFPDGTFDAVLLMGPLYHLLRETDRLQALREAQRVLRPGGPLFAAFISRYAGLRDAAAREPAWLAEHPAEAELMLAKGHLLSGHPEGEGGAGFIAYLAQPAEVGPLCRRTGLEVTTVLGVEGLVSMIERGVNELQGDAWQAWADLNYRLAGDPAIHGAVQHLLVVAHKPAWRTVLRRLGQAMERAGIAYRVVGGTCAALHGAEIAVKDVDIETNAADAYRFETLFADNGLEPVSLRESERYRSHFGRFRFDGVTVELMGDLERREDGNWVPTASSTEAMVDLDGVSIRTGWLEEEVLAYIRRGRLDRAGPVLAPLRSKPAAGLAQTPAGYKGTVRGMHAGRAFATLCGVAISRFPPALVRATRLRRRLADAGDGRQLAHLRFVARRYPDAVALRTFDPA